MTTGTENNKPKILDWDKDVKFEVLSPGMNFPSNGHINDSSIVLKVTYNEVSFLFTGDAEHSSEEEILSLGRKINLKSTIYKAPHHGSKTSSTYDYLKKISPEVAVICVGKNNKFGHPGEETLEKLRELNVKIYRTDYIDFG